MRLIVSPLNGIRGKPWPSAVDYLAMKCRSRLSRRVICKNGSENGDGRLVGITNYEAFKGDEGLRRGRLGALALDESSMLKSRTTGTIGKAIIDLVAVVAGGN